MRWAGRIERMGEVRNAYKFCCQGEAYGGDGKIILR
jgi:hypothetical protein